MYPINRGHRSGVLEEQDVYYGSENFYLVKESAPGGVGQIEDFVLKYSDDPRRFFDLLSFSLSQNDLQSADKALVSFIDLLTSSVDQDLREIVNKIRTTVGNERQSNLQRDLHKRLNEVGLGPFHVNVALNNRILRYSSQSRSFLQACFGILGCRRTKFRIRARCAISSILSCKD